MRNTLLLLILTAGCLFSSCGKEEKGYFSYPLNNLPTRPSADTPSFSQYVYFFGIIIDSNSTYHFGIPELTQGIIDTGTVQITFKSSIVSLLNWYPLPLYTFPDGATVTVKKAGVLPGQVILQDSGQATPAMDYCFYISSSR